LTALGILSKLLGVTSPSGKDPRTLNLATDPWITVRRRDGSLSVVAAWELTREHATNPIVAVDATRKPWNGALTEFLIALFQTVLFPEDARAWRETWDSPPEPDYLRNAFSKIEDLYLLNGEIPFMQDRTLLAGPGMVKQFRKPVQKLLVDGVSELQEKKNSDLFVKSGSVSVLCPPCAAAALWDLQAHSPQGSAGYHTSLRGGGPVSTLVSCDTLWKTVWANVVEQSALGMKGRPDPRSFLPWANPLREKRKEVKPEEECPLHVFWGMPRRVLLEISSGPDVCSTCGRATDMTVRSFLTYRGGRHYAEADWRHPLSPYVRTKESFWVVRRTETDLDGYRHWMGLLVGTPEGDGLPAFVVRRWVERDVPLEPELHVWGYGYQTDQAAVKVWCEGRTPFITLENGHRKEYEAFVRTLVTLSQSAVEHLSDCIKGAWKSSGHFAPLDTTLAQHEFWQSTEPIFLEWTRAAAADPSKESLTKSADAWVVVVQRTALVLYDRALPSNRVQPEWLARYAHKLRRELSSRNPATMKTRRYGDWRITDV
jgi:CRISPR system Cascade subunit CasA